MQATLVVPTLSHYCWQRYLSTDKVQSFFHSTIVHWVTYLSDFLKYMSVTLFLFSNYRIWFSIWMIVWQCDSILCLLFLLESCFRSSLTHRRPPLFCQQGYLKEQGVTHSNQPWQDGHDTVSVPDEQGAGTSVAGSAFSNYLVHGASSLSSGLKLEL